MEILSAKIDDISEILNLQKSCYLEEAQLYNDYKIPPLTQSLESIKQDFEKEIFLKVQFDNKIIGSVRGYINHTTCKIGRLIVHEKHRKKGLGTQLIRAIESKFDSVERFELFTGHRSIKNLSLYHRLGYSEFKRTSINENLELVFLEKINN